MRTTRINNLNHRTMKKSLLHILVSVGIAAIGFFGVACGGDDKGGNGAGGGDLH